MTSRRTPVRGQAFSADEKKSDWEPEALAVAPPADWPLGWAWPTPTGATW